MRAVRPHPASTIFGLIAALLVTTASWGGVARVTDVRLWAGPEGTRLVLDVSGPVAYDVFTLENPHRVVVDLANAELKAAKGLPSGQGPVRKVRSGPQPGHGLRLVLDVDNAQLTKSFMVGPDGAAGHRLVVELPGAGSAAAALAPAPVPVTTAVVQPMPDTGKTAATSAPPETLQPQQVLLATANVAAAVANPSSNPVKSVSSAAKGRDLVIAIDAGHGGQDPGAIGRAGTREKDVTLAIAKRLAAAIDAEEGMRAVLIRDGDYFITLGARTRKARQLGADMFVSVHADSVRNREVSGSSVYVLSLRGASDEAARWLAESENAADLKGGVSLDVKDDVLASVLLDVTQKEAVSDSVEAADNVLVALRGAGKVHGSRVRHAGFIVLKSPDIPSMLVETAFISNSTDERRLRNTDEQQRIAMAIRSGIRNYWHDNAPPGTRLAALIAARRDGLPGTPNTTLAER
jgi:N-acetylmuramoyl-L-alanine amidase